MICSQLHSFAACLTLANTQEKTLRIAWLIFVYYSSICYTSLPLATLYLRWAAWKIMGDGFFEKTSIASHLCVGHFYSLSAIFWMCPLVLESWRQWKCEFCLENSISIARCHKPAPFSEFATSIPRASIWLKELFFPPVGKYTRSYVTLTVRFSAHVTSEKQDRVHFLLCITLLAISNTAQSSIYGWIGSNNICHSRGFLRNNKSRSL
jgi:hypothetical protein